MTNLYVKKIVDDQEKARVIAKEECVHRYGDKALLEIIRPTTINTTSNCPAYWDGILCWPETPPDILATLPCPSYIAGFLPINNATRQCTEKGVWFFNKTLNSSWTNYTTCYKSEITTILVGIEKTNISDILEEYAPVVKIISETGYIVSLITLIIAFSIMLLIKKLHCARNILHMHLFASFILRAFFFIVIDVAFVDGIGLPSDLINNKNGSRYFNIDSETNNWSCKLMTSLCQYFITANYSWILMEGLYLHNLIFRALFADSNNNIRWYIAMGWGLPLIIIAIWVTVRVLVEDSLCWTIHENYKVFLIIAVPTMISILINLVLFIRISMVLYSKLRSPINEDSRRYQKWVKSTLVLVPLFGVHYALFLALYYSIKTNKVVEVVWLICDRLFGSFQGSFVAILYCFLNGEVKSEIQPHFIYCLTFLATNKCSKYVFPFRKKFLRSVVGRSSVCTTMSCSSLYTNGVLHRNSKPRLESLPKIRQQCEKVRDHVCQCGKMSNDTSRRNSKIQMRCCQNERFVQPIIAPNTMAMSEMSHSIEFNQRKCQTETEINEETLRMVPDKNF